MPTLLGSEFERKHRGEGGALIVTGSATAPRHQGRFGEWTKLNGVSCFAPVIMPVSLAEADSVNKLHRNYLPAFEAAHTLLKEVRDAGEPQDQRNQTASIVSARPTVGIATLEYSC